MLFARSYAALPRQFRSLRVRLPSSRLTAPQAASFRTSCALRAGPESSVQDEKRAEKVEAEKQDQLKEQKEGKGKWHPGLATDGEAAVKADRDDITPTKDNIREMQKEGEEKAGKRHY